MNFVKGRSKIALAVANRRFTAVLALTLKSGMELEKGMDLAKELVENEAWQSASGNARNSFRWVRATTRP